MCPESASTAAASTGRITRSPRLTAIRAPVAAPSAKPIETNTAGSQATLSSNTNTGTATSASPATTIILTALARTRSNPDPGQSEYQEDPDTSLDRPAVDADGEEHDFRRSTVTSGELRSRGACGTRAASGSTAAT